MSRSAAAAAVAAVAGFVEKIEAVGMPLDVAAESVLVATLPVGGESAFGKEEVKVKASCQWVAVATAVASCPSGPAAAVHPARRPAGCQQAYGSGPTASEHVWQLCERDRPRERPGQRLPQILAPRLPDTALVRFSKNLMVRLLHLGLHRVIIRALSELLVLKRRN
jgi:hypothetical protein